MFNWLGRGQRQRQEEAYVGSNRDQRTGTESERKMKKIEGTTVHPIVVQVVGQGQGQRQGAVYIGIISWSACADMT